ncbi:MAG: 23S rRNA (pseudouridine(1915)-N(3))-methyltransferase RlmH [Pseudomonadota bacterium]|jgi:23S rRNA (pseudouridine1915-N3)-methyltransferase|nr:23S rRNA (pseudouridine(1915)-N(3))-methyltransferase RlmH [Pseudomonadota bacterium]MED5408571.1 23S rRNA (pseudouridine(1915)-N(3))-methyltransferase RlmH [Pseudomonadota bacterium]MEE3287102.1 23S rRNA (pseudouridine(1915)-N(3))-methyltransferase RlmH [Pseudomonadota bacterium]
MRLLLIAVGRRMPGWVNDGYNEYARRLRGSLKLELVEVDAGRRTRNADIGQLIREEGNKLLACVPSGSRMIALDPRGRQFDTETLSIKLGRWIDESQDVSLLVGGPDGLSEQVLSQADECWSLSALTLAHPLVRVVVAEQVYRMVSILTGLPYHRGNRPGKKDAP